MWDTKDPDLDDPLHNPDPIRDAALDHAWTIWSSRGWANAIMLVLIMFGLLVLFAGYPVIHFVQQAGQKKLGGFGIGGVNATGQIPSLPGMPTLIDPATPEVFRTRTGTDGKQYLLVFSDEFETEGRSFYPGDDPFWEAVDLNYWCVMRKLSWISSHCFQAYRRCRMV
jgi:beta-glucan synthesis-associated protein KRE6